MNDPFTVLGVERQATAEDVRRRYLELVRLYPPDRDPERFAAVREAYEQLRNPAVRLEAQLFEVATPDSLDQLISDLKDRLRDARLPTKILLALAERS